MGTKLEPGKFDCYHAAAPDEPMFVLLARDPDAPRLVRSWARRYWWRKVFWNFVKFVFCGVSMSVAVSHHRTVLKWQEARHCARNMGYWRQRQGGDSHL